MGECGTWNFTATAWRLNRFEFEIGSEPLSREFLAQLE